MGDVVELRLRPSDDDVPHLSGRCVCLACRHEWLGVSPVGKPDGLECPACHLLKGAHVGLAYPSADAWQCQCGCILFFVTRTEYVCALCGTGQRF